MLPKKKELREKRNYKGELNRALIYGRNERENYGERDGLVKLMGDRPDQIAAIPNYGRKTPIKSRSYYKWNGMEELIKGGLMDLMEANY